jgi:hypothetical protein
MQLLEETLLSMDAAIPYSGTGEPNYLELLERAENSSYDMSQPQRRYAIELLEQLMGLIPGIAKARQMNHSFATKAPKPQPDLRVTPHF